MAGRVLSLRVALVLGLLVFTIASSAASLAWAILLRLRLVDLRTHYRGDPEKSFMDKCMRDFEGLGLDDPKEEARYLKEHKECITELHGKDEFKHLPLIRPTVDEGICDQAALCEDSDPGQCADKGEPREEGYQEGDVTKCFRLLDEAVRELDPDQHDSLMKDAQQRCTRSGRWTDYAHRVQLEYCMWKQSTVGACTNNLRTNCPGDSSCCPTAQNHLKAEDVSLLNRPDKYICQKSPLIGLYCQHSDFRLPTNNLSMASRMPLCTAETCPNFNWCREFADITEQCLTDPCKDYQRVLALAVAIVAAAALGLLLDLFDIFMFLRYPTRQQPKATADVVAIFSKLLCLLLCFAGGARDFASEASSRACLHGENGETASGAEAAAEWFLFAALLSTVGSACLAPTSVRMGGNKLNRLPYARVH